MPQALTIERAEASCISPYREPTASDVQADLEMTKLGVALTALLEQAAEVLRNSDRLWADSVVSLRQRSFRMTPEAMLAELLIDRLGPAEDCYLMREVAERAVAA